MYSSPVVGPENYLKVSNLRLINNSSCNSVMLFPQWLRIVAQWFIVVHKVNLWQAWGVGWGAIMAGNYNTLCTSEWMVTVDVHTDILRGRCLF